MKIWVKKFHENPIVTDFYLDTIAEIFKRKNFEIESIRDWNRYKPQKNDLTLVGTTLDALKPVIKRNKYILWIQGIWPEECFYNHKKKWEYYLTSVIELIALKNAKFAMFATTLAAIFNLVLNFIFIKKYGFIAAGYTTLICYIILTAFHYGNVKKLGLADCIDNRKIFVLSLFVVICSFGINILYSVQGLRYLIIIVIVICCMVKKNEIVRIIKN